MSASTVQANVEAAASTANDIELTSPPGDGISDLSFSPQADHLAVASWDRKVRIYEIAPSGASEGKALFEHNAPVLNVCWTRDGTKVVGAGADNAARLLDLGSGATTATQVAAHDRPIRCCRFVEVSGTQILATGSWDKTVKYWDLRQSTPIGSLECQERVYSMDARNKLLVIGAADRYIHVINLDQPEKFFRSYQSPLKWQTRVVSCFIDASGFAVGSIEGRCTLVTIKDKDRDIRTAFKCHRSPPINNIVNVYALNAISFHPVYGTLSTAGSDGTFCFWDKGARCQLKHYQHVGNSISATDFNRDGSMFAYAVSYDWSKGYATNTPQAVNKVMLHSVAGDECKPKPKATGKK